MKALSVFHNRPIGLLADKTWQLLPMNITSPPSPFSEKLVLILSRISDNVHRQKKGNNENKVTGEI